MVYIKKGRRKAHIYNSNVTSEQVAKYIPACNFVINKYIVRCFRGIYISEKYLDVALGNSGWTIRDVQSHLMAEAFIALTHFNPTYITPENLTVKESTFVLGHLHKRCCYLASKITGVHKGYHTDICSLESLEDFDD
jgi:hypothetical protein